jgi:cell division protein FtsB
MKDKETIFPNKCDTIDQQKREIEKLKAEIYDLKERNKKLSKRHPTKEEALAQYHWLKENSKRNK